MKLILDYDPKPQYIVISTDTPESNEWKNFFNLTTSSTPVLKCQTDRIVYYVPDFVKCSTDIISYGTSHGFFINSSDRFKELTNRISVIPYTEALKAQTRTETEINNILLCKGFKRKLKPNQLHNIMKISSLPGCASFSVPGAGKTTEALAYFCLNSEKQSKLLVVAPKNVLVAWDEQIKDCIPDQDYHFIRLTGGRDNIRKLLSDSPDFSIVTYQQLPLIVDYIKDYLLKFPNSFIFLDESHKIKGNKVYAQAVNEISMYAPYKMILSGTPMPQSVKDLVPQFRFLYPTEPSDEYSVVGQFQPIFVRTTQDQLGIPKIDRRLIKLNMSEIQNDVHKLLKSEMRRQLNGVLDDDSKSQLRRLGKCTMKMLQFVSNPSLLASDMNYIFNPKMGQLLMSCNGPKIEYACKRARQLAAEGKKVIIWTSFVKNVEYLAKRLSDLGAEFIHGGVEAGSDSELTTREGKLKNFHQNPKAMVLVANPAAASEGISLHTVCQHAIYLDRTFNAAQYLQSEDRIHRLGLREDQVPVEEIIQCTGTIDEVVQSRLYEKVKAMSKVLNDPSLDISALSFDYDESDDEYAYLSKKDVKEVYNYFFKEGQ